jgi:ribosomal protein S18 acetylase RimI-like enzyme
MSENSGDETRQNREKINTDSFQTEIFIQKLCRQSPIDLEQHTVDISALAGEIWREHYTPIIGAPQVEYMLDKLQSAKQIYTDIKENGYVYLTARHKTQGPMIGYCGIKPADGYLVISKLYIRRDYRDKGIARIFLNEVTALCRYQYMVDKIRLDVDTHNEDAIAAYKKIGFEIIGLVRDDIGGGFYMEGYTMELSQID